LMTRSGKPLSELASVMSALPQVLKNVKVREKKDLDEIAEVRKSVSSVKERLKDQGRVLVRY
jgi:phosphoglucosamine mutase